MTKSTKLFFMTLLLGASILAFYTIQSYVVSLNLPSADCSEGTLGFLPCFCENLSTTGLVQPINSLSSFAYILLGLWILYPLRKTDNSVRRKADFGYAFVFAAAMIVLGIGSALMHGTFAYISVAFDVIPMFMLFSVIIARATVQYFNLRSRMFWPILGALLAFALIDCLVSFYIHNVPLHFIPFLIYIATALILEILLFVRRPTINKLALLTSFCLFVFSITIWLADSYGILCFPQSLFQGHAFWHIGTAFALYMLFRYQYGYADKELPHSHFVQGVKALHAKRKKL